MKQVEFARSGGFSLNEVKESSEVVPNGREVFVAEGSPMLMGKIFRDVPLLMRLRLFSSKEAKIAPVRLIPEKK